MKNLHKLFYKDYFKDIDFSFLFQRDKSQKEIIEKNNIKKLNKINDYLVNKTGINWRNKEDLRIIPNPAGNAVHNINLEIQYPGLVTGVGITHEAGIEGELKLGVHFDYTYGMPVVYGSSVKGVLRSACTDKAYIKEILGKDIDTEILIKDIFEGKTCINPEVDDKNKRIYKNRSIYQRDIFFDGVIIKPDSKGRFLTTDSITPHKDPLKNPIPITFMKIASGSIMQFRFKLVDYTILKIDEKLILFTSILRDFGVGAKTNVGYGQLE